MYVLWLKLGHQLDNDSKQSRKFRKNGYKRKESRCHIVTEYSTSAFNQCECCGGTLSELCINEYPQTLII